MPACACLVTSQAPVAVCSARLVRSALAALLVRQQSLSVHQEPPHHLGSDSTADCVCQSGYGKPIVVCIIQLARLDRYPSIM